MTEREFAIDVVRRLAGAGFRALWAGGCVRDELLGLVPKDYDVATDARPEAVRGLFRRTVAVGECFGVVEVIGPRDEHGRHHVVQVATFRTDGDYPDERRPGSVEFSTPEEDALRRDFTVNGMFFDPLAGEVIDYVGGRDDLVARVLRAIGDPEQRFREDKLRLLRAARIAARFGLTVEAGTAAAVRRMASRLPVVSAERIAEELRRMLSDPSRAEGVALLADLHLLAPVLPELAGHAADLPHARSLLAYLPADADFPLALAGLLRPLGPKEVGKLARRLRLSNEERERAEWLAAHRTALRDPATPAHTAKVLLAHPGADDLLALHRAEARAGGGSDAFVDDWEARRGAWRERGALDPPPLVTGDDLKERGLEPGPTFRRLLEAVRRAQLDETLATKAEGLALVDRLTADGE
jgi:poly(A) polymerase